MFFSAETTFGISVFHMNETSLYTPRNYLDLKVAIEKTIDTGWSSKDPIKFAQIKHPTVNSVSVLDKN